MKKHFTRLILLSVSIFGLCSCNSDSPPDKAPSTQQIKGLSYVHADRSRHQILDTHELTLESYIEFDIPADFINYRVNTQSQCTTQPSGIKSQHTNQWESESRLPVKDLIPMKAFQVFNNQDHQVYCEFQFQITSKDQIVTTASLKRLLIKNSAHYSNWPFIENSSEKKVYLLLDDVLEKDFTPPLNSGNIHLLCEDTTRSSNWEDPSSSFETFSEQGFFNFKGLQLCRIVLENHNLKQRFISKTFYFQKETPKIQIKHKLDFKAEYDGDYTDKSLLQVHVKNVSDQTTFIKVATLNTSQLNLKSVYTNGWNNFHITHEMGGTDLSWYLEADIIDESDDGTFNIITLAPQQKLTLNAYSTLKVSCATTLLVAPMDEVSCLNTPFFNGFQYSIKNLPKILTSKFSASSADQWKIHAINEIFYNSSEQYPFWTGTRRVNVNECNSIVRFDESAPSHPSRAAEDPYYKCKLL